MYKEMVFHIQKKNTSVIIYYAKACFTIGAQKKMGDMRTMG